MTFCSSCGVKAVDGALYCHQCGFSVAQAGAVDISRPQQVSSIPATCSNEAVSSRFKPSGAGAPLLSFTDFRRQKESDRQKKFTTKSSGKRKRQEQDKDKVKVVNCKIALVTYREDTNCLKLVRGSQHSLALSSASTANELRVEAVKKLSRFNRSVSNCPEQYCLLYPDLTFVCMIPGTEKAFTLKEYKDELGKPYERLTFYISKREDYLANEGIDEENEDDNLQLSSNQLIKPCYIHVDDSYEEESGNSRINSYDTDITSVTDIASVSDVQALDNNTALSSGAFAAPSTSQACNEDVPQDLDSIYATLLFDEINSELYENDFVGMVEGNAHDVFFDDTEEDITLQEVLANLAQVLTSEEVSMFNLSRNDMWEGTKRAMNRKSFSPQNKLSVKFMDDIGQPEGAIDMGGPTREFFTIITEWLVNSRLFFGEPTAKFLSLNAACLEGKEYFMAGQIFAMSLVHGGPGINCLSSSCYDAIVKRSGTLNLGATLEEIPDLELKSSLRKLLQAPSVGDAHQIISDEKLDTIIDMAGTMQVIRTKADIDKMVQLTINWHVLGRSQPSYCSFREGLQSLGVLEAIETHSKLFKDVFCYKSECLTAGMMESVFKVNGAEEGSNQRHVESLVLSYWNDVLQDAEEDPSEISLSEILFFVSGCKVLPTRSIQGEVQFLHDVESDGNLSTLPKANTCILKLPIVHKDYKSFKNAMIFAIKNSRGFGCP